MRLAPILALALLAAGCHEKPSAAAAAGAAGGSAPASQARGEWPTYHGSYALEGVSEASPPDAPERLWKFKAGSRVDFTPVSAGGRIFFATAKGGLFSLDLAGNQVWKSDLEKDACSTPPLLCDGLLVLGTTNGTLCAFDAATGKSRWKYDVGGNVQGTPNRVDLAGGRKGVIVISQGDGTIHAVDLETGKGAWKTEAVERCDGSAGVGSGRIVMGSCASALHLYSVEKAEKITDIPLGGDGQVAGGVAISGRTAFAGQRNGKVVAADLVEAKILWTNADNQREAFTTPAVNDRFVVFGSDDDRVYALRRDTGAKVWDFNTQHKPSSPVIAGRRVVVGSGGKLYLLDLETGAKVWSAEVSDDVTSPAAVAGMIVVGGDDGTVTAFGKK